MRTFDEASSFSTGDKARSELRPAYVGVSESYNVMPSYPVHVAYEANPLAKALWPKHSKSTRTSLRPTPSPNDCRDL